ARYRDELARGRVLRRIDVHLDRALEEPACRLEEPPAQIGVVLVLGDLLHARHADGDADHLIGETGEVLGHVVVLLEARDEHVEVRLPREASLRRGLPAGTRPWPITSFMFPARPTPLLSRSAFVAGDREGSMAKQIRPVPVKVA